MSSPKHKILPGDIIAGLDIGTTKIVAIVAKVNEHHKIEVLGMGRVASSGVDKNDGVVNVVQTVDAIKQAVKLAEENAGVNIRTVFVGIAGQHIKSSKHTGIIIRDQIDEPINTGDIQRLIDDMFKLQVDPGEQIINVLPQDFIVDTSRSIVDPRGMIGTRLTGNFHIITARLNAVKVIYRCVLDAGLEIAGSTLEPLASSASVLTAEEIEAGVVLVDIGGGTTDIAIFKDNVIHHTGVIGYGGNIVTMDIKQDCSVMQNIAEKLKVEYGCAMPNEMDQNQVITIKGMRWNPAQEISLYQLSKIIHARMEDIVNAVKSHITNAGFDQRKLIAGIVLTGGGSQLKHLTKLFDVNTGIATRIGLPVAYVANTDKDLFSNASHSTVIGLVKWGYENGSLKPLNNSYKNVEVVAEPIAEAQVAPVNEVQVDAVNGVMDVPQQEPVLESEPIVAGDKTREIVKEKSRFSLTAILKMTKDLFEGDEDPNIDK